VAISHQPPSLLFTGWLSADNWTLFLTNQLLHFTSLHFTQLNCWQLTAAPLVSALYNLGADLTENTASNNPSSVVLGCWLAINWISFPQELIYRPLPRNGFLSSYCVATAVLVARFEVSVQQRVCTPQYCQGDEIKKNDVYPWYVARMGVMICIQNFSAKTRREEICLNIFEKPGMLQA
jgi:hypothetical protein